MRALVLDAEKKTAHVQNISPPTPGPEDLLIKVHAIALNPIDPLYVSNPLGATGRIIGSDFAGTITTIGSSVPKHLKIGDRVAGFLQGACSINERPGAFAEYLISPWDLVWRVPSSMPLEEAATISLCSLTAAQALFFRVGLPAPFPWNNQPAKPPSTDSTPLNIIIYSASTSVALYAAQLVHHSARASGIPITLYGTASPARFPLLKSEPYSYDHLVSYRDASWPEQIKKLTNGVGIHYAYDCISERSSVSLVSSTLAPNGRIAIVRSREGGAWTSDNLSAEPIYGAVWEGLGVEVQYQGMTLPASAEARAFAVAFYRRLEGDEVLEANPVRLMPGGLERVVEDGFALLGDGSMGDRGKGKEEEYMRPVSAEKLVYKV